MRILGHTGRILGSYLRDFYDHNIQALSRWLSLRIFCVAYLCFVCASPESTASTHSYKMKYQEYKGLYYNAWSTNNIVLLKLERHNATNLLQLQEWLSKWNYKSSFLHSSIGRRVGRRLVTEAQQSSIFTVATCNMIRCSHGGSIHWMYWQDVTMVDSMAPTLICYLARWSFDLANHAFSYLCKNSSFSLANFFDKKELLLPKFTHQILT
jgi:hypothetical protein